MKYKVKAEDGYEVIPPLPDDSERIKGVKCGQCGMKFTYGEPVMFTCSHGRCPIMKSPWPYPGVFIRGYDQVTRTFFP